MKQYIEKNHLIKKNEVIVIGLSGGKDSASVLHILDKIQSNEFPFQIKAVTINEGIKHYSDSCIEFAEMNAKIHDIKHATFSFKQFFGFTLDEILIKKKGSIPCSLCGLLRRRALNMALREFNADKLATGHNLDDESQSYLMNILDGNPAYNVISKQYHIGFLPRIKPLASIFEKEIDMYARHNNLFFSKNKCPYKVLGMRGEVAGFLDQLEKRHPDIKYKIISSSKKQFLHRKNKPTVIRHCQQCGWPSRRSPCDVCILLNDLKSDHLETFSEKRVNF